MWFPSARAASCGVTAKGPEAGVVFLHTYFKDATLEIMDRGYQCACAKKDRTGSFLGLAGCKIPLYECFFRDVKFRI